MPTAAPVPLPQSAPMTRANWAACPVPAWRATTVYAHWSANGGSAEVVEEKEVDPDPLLTTMGLAAGSVVLVLLASLAL